MPTPGERTKTAGIMTAQLVSIITTTAILPTSTQAVFVLIIIKIRPHITIPSMTIVTKILVTELWLLS